MHGLTRAKCAPGTLRGKQAAAGIGDPSFQPVALCATGGTRSGPDCRAANRAVPRRSGPFPEGDVLQRSSGLPVFRLPWVQRADKKSSLIGGKRVARNMPFSRDRISRACRVGRGTPRPTRTPRYAISRPCLSWLCRLSAHPHTRPLPPGNTVGEGSTGSLRATATLIACASILRFRRPLYQPSGGKPVAPPVHMVRCSHHDASVHPLRSRRANECRWTDALDRRRVAWDGTRG